jgi:thioredoxin 1
VTVATIPKNMNMETRNMSKIDVEYELENALKGKEKVYVLFYASWCPFSRRFLPIFEKYSEDSPQNCLQVKIDDKPKLSEKYEVDVVPTVLVFEMGKVTKRLDGKPGTGLDEKQFKKLTKS